MTDKERKNFSIQVQEEVYKEQGGQCYKCGKSIQYGYYAHHKDADKSNDKKENCGLLCQACHAGEQYSTLRMQKEKVIFDLDSLVKKGVEGGLPGTTIKELHECISEKLSLQRQLNDDPPTQAPVETRMRDYQILMEAKLEAFEEGIKKGLEKGIDLCVDEAYGHRAIEDKIKRKKNE
jgi:hypothetical protein